jgi:hypothetical protein
MLEHMAPAIPIKYPRLSIFLPLANPQDLCHSPGDEKYSLVDIELQVD